MSDATSLDREPVELIEIITPKCANVHGSAPCTATEVGDGKCFNTRTTCNDADSYQARPLTNLTPDATLAQGGTFDPSPRRQSDTFEVGVRFDAGATGTIISISGSPAAT